LGKPLGNISISVGCWGDVGIEGEVVGVEVVGVEAVEVEEVEVKEVEVEEVEEVEVEEVEVEEIEDTLPAISGGQGMWLRVVLSTSRSSCMGPENCSGAMPCPPAYL
jgi:hypothetical protein